METFAITMMAVAAAACLFLAWLYTPRGKKWLKDL